MLKSFEPSLTVGLLPRKQTSLLSEAKRFEQHWQLAFDADVVHAL